MQNNPLIQFLTELILRLGAKSPRIFVILQWISGALAGITGIPTIIQTFGIVLPHPFDTELTKIVAIASTVALFFSKLPVKDKIVAVTTSGQPLKKTDDCVLPFTDSEEKKSISSTTTTTTTVKP
jgi:hypothetical protein